MDPPLERVAANPKPLLGLGLCSQEWLAESIDILIRAESEANFAGDDLVHNDIYSGNVGFRTSGAVLVDWGAAVRGTRWVDVVLALLSLRVEGAVPSAVASPEIPPLAVAFAGHFALEAPAPLPDWAEEGSTLREDMAGDLAHALRWAVRAPGAASVARIRTYVLYSADAGRVPDRALQDGPHACGACR